MTFRACTYKDCDNYYADGRAAGNFTMFGFPKNDPERAQQWSKLGCVNPNIAPHQLYMCSEHFDPKYLSISNKRTLLLSKAIPYAYEKQSSARKNYSIKIHPYVERGAEVESTTDIQDIIETVDTDEDVEVVHTIKVVLPTESTEEERPNTKRQRLSIESGPSKSATEIQDEPKDEDTIDAAEVTTFIFKGEEYVQMSKEFYLREKRELLQNVQRYERALNSIQTTILELGL